jgi:hypothetical protein
VISKQLTDLAGASGTLQLNLQATLDDARKQLVTELEKQSGLLMGLTVMSNPNQVYSASYQATLGRLPSAIQRLVEETRKITTSQRILESLRFEEIKLREEQIHPAHAKTFTWIFEDNATPFKRWLTSDDGIFWVNGKAGSGKSTLMKFLANHAETRNILRQWSSGVGLIVASFYFWTAGRDAQKSQLGLMKSLLYQIFRQCPDLIPSQWSSRFDSDGFLDKGFEGWSRQELSDAVDNIIARGSLASRFCFFVDGLDEYGDAQFGDHYALIQYLDHLTQSSCVKICVSSRPWTVFKDRYNEHDDLKFVLQDLTSEDMLTYAMGQLQDDERFRRLASREPQALLLATHIRDKAEGVFLWVSLVTRSLKRGLSEHDDTKELERRLAQTPSDLLEFFRSILRNIDDNYKDYTMRALQILAVSGSTPLGVLQYIPQEIEDRTYAIRQEIHFDEPTVDLRGWTPPAALDVEAKVNKWCRDLLEVSHDDKSREKWLVSVPEGDVTFLHRTVYDFLRSREMQDMFETYSVCAPSVDRALCQMFLAYTKSCCSMMRPDPTYGPGETDRILIWARSSEYHDEETPLEILDELKRILLAFEEYWSRLRRKSGLYQPSLLRLAVRINLLLYIDQARDRDILAEPGILWDTLYRMLHSKGYEQPRYSQDTGLPMITKLIEKGCSPNDIWIGEDPRRGTVWQKLMSEVYSPGDPTNSATWFDDDEERVKAARIVAFLLEHGADLDAKFEVQAEGQEVRLADTHEFLMQVFDGDRSKIDALQKKARKVRSTAAGKKSGFLARLVGWPT